MQTQEKRDQKGVWKKAAPCLYQYQSNRVYYAVVRRAGKLIRKSLEVTQLEVAKRKLRDYLNDLENNAPDAHKVRLDDYMKEFLGGRRPSLPVSPTRVLTGYPAPRCDGQKSASFTDAS